jgi:hypothetical protein
MAINQANQAIGACKSIVDYATQIANALDGIESIGEQLTGANIVLTGFSAEIEADPAIQHCDASTFQNIILFAASTVAALKADYDGTPTQQGWAAFMKARRVR